MEDGPVLDVEDVGQERRRRARADGAPPVPPPAIEWTNVRVAGVVVAAVIVGMLTGLVLFRTDPDLELLEARQELRERDETIAELQGRVEMLEAELRSVSPGAVERARREQELAAREAAVAQREAAVTEREKELEGLWTLPRFSIPDADAIGRFFDRFNSRFSDAVGGDESALDRATRPGTTGGP